MTAKEFLKEKGYYAGSLMLSKTKGVGLVSIEQAMQEYADQKLTIDGVVVQKGTCECGRQKKCGVRSGLCTITGIWHT